MGSYAGDRKELLPRPHSRTGLTPYLFVDQALELEVPVEVPKEKTYPRYEQLLDTFCGRSSIVLM